MWKTWRTCQLFLPPGRLKTDACCLLLPVALSCCGLLPIAILRWLGLVSIAEKVSSYGGAVIQWFRIGSRLEQLKRSAFAEDNFAKDQDRGWHHLQIITLWHWGTQRGTGRPLTMLTIQCSCSSAQEKLLLVDYLFEEGEDRTQQNSPSMQLRKTLPTPGYWMLINSFKAVVWLESLEKAASSWGSVARVLLLETHKAAFTLGINLCPIDIVGDVGGRGTVFVDWASAQLSEHPMPNFRAFTSFKVWLPPFVCAWRSTWVNEPTTSIYFKLL